MEHVNTVVVGAGQAGLAVSHELASRGIDHVVLERGRIGETWRHRWDSFCLVTPNWSVLLPGYPYDGTDPDGFMPRDEIVAYLERYARSFGAPVREGVQVGAVTSNHGGFQLYTSSGLLRADTLVVAAGAYQRPHRPPGAATLPADLPQMDVGDYRNPAALPAGRVLIVGSGQSGAQIAEELRQAGLDVYLSCGRAPLVPRQILGHDVVWWMRETGLFDQRLEALGPAERLVANPLATGHGGGHDLNLRILQASGVKLAGHFLGAEGWTARFAADLGEMVAWGDQRYRGFMTAVRTAAEERGLELPEEPEPAPFDDAGPETLDLTGFGAVIFAAGFRPGYRSWLPWQDAFDEVGFPIQEDGRSTVVRGLYFVGIPFLRTRKSALLLGVGEDATIVAQSIADATRATA